MSLFEGYERRIDKINNAIKALGGGPINFVGNPKWAIWTVIFVTG